MYRLFAAAPCGRFLFGVVSVRCENRYVGKVCANPSPPSPPSQPFPERIRRGWLAGLLHRHVQCNLVCDTRVHGSRGALCPAAVQTDRLATPAGRQQGKSNIINHQQRSSTLFDAISLSVERLKGEMKLQLNIHIQNSYRDALARPPALHPLSPCWEAPAIRAFLPATEPGHG